MPVDLATLAIEVRGRGIAETSAQLNNLTNAAGRAEAAAVRLQITQNNLASSVYRMHAAESAAVAGRARQERATLSLATAQERHNIQVIRAQVAHTAAETALLRAQNAADRAARSTVALGATASRTADGFKSAARDMSAMLMTAQTGISGLPYALTRATSGFTMLMVTGVLAAAGITAAFAKGISVVDNFQVSVISIAAGLTNVAKAGQGDFGEMFARNKVHAVEMYKAITLEEVKHFATANEMMIVYNKLVQGGYAVRQDEVAALGTITDLIRLKTKGQDTDRQLNTEIMALMQGQARQGSLLAQELLTRLGPGWADLVDKHRKAGDLLTWLASLYPGLTAANKDILNTMDSQWATTKSLMELVAIGGLQTAYMDIVGIMRQINDYLLVHRDEISGAIARGWQVVKELAEGTLGVIQAIYLIVSTPITWVITISSKIIGPLADFLAGKTGSTSTTAGAMAAGFGGGEWTDIYKETPEAKTAQNKALAAAAEKYKSETYQQYLKALGPTKAEAGAGGKTKKGGGGRDATQGIYNKFQQMIDTYQMEIDRINEEGGKAAALDAWLTKQNDAIDAAFGRRKKTSIDELTLEEQYAAVKEAAAKAHQAKITKLSEDFELRMAKLSGDKFITLQEQYRRDIGDWGRTEEDKARITAVYQNLMQAQAIKNSDEILGRRKEYLSAVANLSPFLSDQLAIQAQVLRIEEQQSKNKLDMMLYDHTINATEWRTLEGLRAQSAELAKQDLVRKGWARAGIGGAIKLWGTERMVAAETRTAEDFKSMMQATETWLGQSFGQTAYDTMMGKKTDFEKMWQDIMSKAMTWLFEQSARTVFDRLGALAGERPSATGIAGRAGPGRYATPELRLGRYGAGAQAGGGAGGAGMGRGSYAPEGGGLTYGGYGRGIDYKGVEKAFKGSAEDLTGSAGNLDMSSVNFDTNSESFSQSATGQQMANVQMGLAAGGMLLAGIGVMTGSQFLVQAGMVLQAAALALQTAVLIMETTSMIPGFHGGGVITAHGGWPQLHHDERIIKAQTGERVLSRSQNKAYEEGMAGSSTTSVNAPISITIQPKQEMTQADYDRHSRMIVKSLNKHLGTRGQKLGDGRY